MRWGDETGHLAQRVFLLKGTFMVDFMREQISEITGIYDLSENEKKNMKRSAMYEYPPQAILDQIATWENYSLEGIEELFELIRDWWWMPTWGFKKIDSGHYELHTGGWSGNEEIIRALEKNEMLWEILLSEYRRGGHYKLEAPYR